MTLLSKLLYTREKRKIILLIFCIFQALPSIAQMHQEKQLSPSTKDILRDFQSYYAYENEQVNLTSDYTATDVAGRPLSKTEFLKALSSGGYLPLKINTGGAPVYRLYKLTSSTLADIAGRLKQLGQQYYQYDQMEGKSLPKFSFTDLLGRTYTPGNTKGKFIILKCWFIHCLVCVQEMPELNKLADQYKHRNDIIFLSLAFDPAKDLKVFLGKNEFKYAVVPDQKGYLINKLKIASYPTHLIIGRNGKIMKVVDNADQLITTLKALVPLNN